MGQIEKQFKGKVVFKHETEAVWHTSNNGGPVEYVPAAGEKVLYDRDDNHNYTRIKYGDGTHIVAELPFSTEQSDWSQTDETAADYIKNKPNLADYENVQADWNQQNSTKSDYIRHKPDIKQSNNILQLGFTGSGLDEISLRTEALQSGKVGHASVRVVSDDEDSHVNIYVSKADGEFEMPDESSISILPTGIDVNTESLNVNTEALNINTRGITSKNDLSVFSEGDTSILAVDFDNDPYNYGLAQISKDQVKLTYSADDHSKSELILNKGIQLSSYGSTDSYDSDYGVSIIAQTPGINNELTLKTNNEYGEVLITEGIDNGGKAHADIEATMGHYSATISADSLSGVYLSYNSLSNDVDSHISARDENIELSTSNQYGESIVKVNVSGGGGSDVHIRADEEACGQAHYGDVKISTSDITIEHNDNSNNLSKIALSGDILLEAREHEKSAGINIDPTSGVNLDYSGGSDGKSSIGLGPDQIDITAVTVKINGTLDANIPASRITGTIPNSLLPSFVDDVIEGTYSTFPTTGESDKIYIDTDTNKSYRWGGAASGYVEISKSLALGETEATAYRGDRGKIAYDHSQSQHAPADAEKNVQSNWNETDTSSDAYIANKPEFEKGTSEHSIQQTGNTALGVGTVSMGANSVAGSKCYYINGVDFTNKQIYLSKTQKNLQNIDIELIFDSYISVAEEDVVYTYNGVFACDGKNYNSITLYQSSGMALTLKYGNNIIIDGVQGEEWKDQKYRTITFNRADVSSEFYDFVTLHGTLKYFNEIDSTISIAEELRNEIVGKYIFIRNARHYEFLAKVVSCTQEGIITYDGTLGFTEFVCLEEDDIPKPDEWTLRIPEVPEFGAVVLAKNEGRDSAATNGASCHAAGIDSFSVNMNNISGGHYSFTSGRDNMAGYGGFSTGGSNKSTALYGFTSGIGNIAGYDPTISGNKILQNLQTDARYYDYATAQGSQNKALRFAAHAIGAQTVASGKASLSTGFSTEASGDYSISGGQKTKAIGIGAVVFGNTSSAEGYNALVSGLKVVVNGHHSFGVGRENTIYANANYNAVMGQQNELYGTHSIVSGKQNTVSASANYNAVFGQSNNVSGTHGIVTGEGNITGVNATHSIVFGKGNTVNTKQSAAIGLNNQILLTDKDGNVISNSKTYGTSFIFGSDNISRNMYNTTFGVGCENSGSYSLLAGEKLFTAASRSGVIGFHSNIQSNAHYSFVAGWGNTTSYSSTIVAGRGLEAGYASQAVFGKFNVVDNDALLVIGNGSGSIDNKSGVVTKTSPSNAMVVKNNGDLIVAGNIKVGNTILTETKLKKLIEFIDSIED